MEMLGVGLIITLLLAAWMGWRWYEHRRRPAPGAEEMILVIGPAEVTVISPTPVVEIDPPTVPVEVIGPIPVPVLGRQPRGAWDEKGWSRSVERGRTVYVGYYQVTDERTGELRRFRGQVVEDHRAKRAVPWIEAPPPEIDRHPKRPCFRHVHEGWYEVNWYRPAKHADEAILYLEAVLDQAINGRVA